MEEVSTTGIHIPFPLLGGVFNHATLWLHSGSDNDIRVSGDVCYEVHDQNSDYLNQVNAFISNKTQTEFNGKWMLLVEWDKVHPYPHGSGSSSWWWYWYSKDLKEFTNSVSLILNNC